MSTVPLLVATPARQELTCPECQEPRVFEQPPCADGHGTDCPDLACCVCGTAVVIGGVDGKVVDAAAPALPVRSVA